ncbi:MAG: hypothetical protein K0Q73_8408 [Paenibacillus sp.]|jgi:uncharacterized protein YbcI|nr:hypothetical protein [Paenibacillus sp.]
MLEQWLNEIKQTYLECEFEILGEKPASIEARVIENRIIFLVKGSHTIEETIDRHSIRGHNIHHTLCEIERQHFEDLLKRKFLELVGCKVVSIQSDIRLNQGEKMEIIHFDCDLEAMLRRK